MEALADSEPTQMGKAVNLRAALNLGGKNSYLVGEQPRMNANQR
jgi:hypothetical protein